MPASIQRDVGREYYDDLAGGLLHAYVYGNPRMQAALRFARAWTPLDARRVLDVGCGIGESTAALHRHCPRAAVLGVDFSARLIGVARRLFADNGVAFEVADVTQDATAITPEFDAIVLIDVFEHVPLAARPALLAALDRLLSPTGRILLTTPSVSYQRYLRDERPQDLQPIDEEVSRDDLEQLATHVHGTLAHFEPVSIWRPDDYVHAAITRGAAAGDAAGRADAASGDPDLAERSGLVGSRLGVRVSRQGALLPRRDGPKVCIIQPNCDAYSERLIRDHLERLPADVIMLCDGWFPTRQWNGERLLPVPFRAARRAANAFGRVAGGLARRISSHGLARYLRAERVDVVLAEYGPMGVAIADACRIAKVPYVVHFHGFDAHHVPTVEQHRAGYRRMFESAAAIVVVSRKMAAQLLALGAPRDKVRYNAAGVDLSRFAGADPSSAPPTFVSVGRFVDKKAPHLTLAAFARVRTACPAARLIMFGDGLLLDSSRELTRTLAIADAVEFRGACRHTEVAAALRAARAFVLHSVETPEGDSEGTPVALLEAAASGLPIVSTRHAGIADVVLDGRMGFLVAEGDVPAMAEHMIELAANPELAGRLGARARAHTSDHYSIEKSIDGLWAVLNAAGRTVEGTLR